MYVQPTDMTMINSPDNNTYMFSQDLKSSSTPDRQVRPV